MKRGSLLVVGAVPGLYRMRWRNRLRHGQSWCAWLLRTCHILQKWDLLHVPGILRPCPRSSELQGVLKRLFCVP
jgi:hypothetical protein